MKVEPRFLTADGPQIFTGNEALLKGALEAEGGIHYLGGYPGSPVSGFFDSFALLKDLFNDKGIRAVINNNEALAAAALNGTQTLPARAIIAMKSVGVHVAADALALGNMAGAHRDGGAIVVYGDDPWSDSTQVASDSRFISRHLYIPTIEPSDIQEVKDFVDLALKISRRSELFAGLVVTNNLADGGGTVTCRPNQYPSHNTRNKWDLDTASIPLNKRVLLPPKTWWQEEAFAPRFERAKAAARELGVNRIEFAAPSTPPGALKAPGVFTGGEKKAIGFITSGLAHTYLTQALYEMGQHGNWPVLKLGMSYPVDEVMVRRLAELCERIVVVEERRSFVEEQVVQIILADRQAGLASGGVEVWGKTFPSGLAGLPFTRGLHPSILISRLAPLLKQVLGQGARITVPAEYEALDRELETIDVTAQSGMFNMPPRLPTFCPGCPHRDSAGLCLEIQKKFKNPQYMRRVHEREPVDLIFHGDTGCYTMLMFPPTTSLMHDYSGMGLGGGTGSGTGPFVTNKAVVFMGDSTFFHSGSIAISHAIKIKQDITFIILDNSTTAMTGHQPTPGVDYDALGNPTPRQDIEEIVRGIAGEAEVPIIRVDPEKRRQYRQLLEELFLSDGVKVVIADKECGITRQRRLRRSERSAAKRLGYVPAWEHMNINPDVCRFCLSCAEMTGCPGLTHVQTDYGPKMDTSMSSCVNDGACARIGACSSFERVTIRRKKPPRARIPELELEDIPEPPMRRQVGDVWRACLTGVGGMGAGVATQVLVRAAHKEGYPVLFLDKKGLAIRNGAVISEVVYNVARQPITAIIPYGKADLLLGMDIMGAAQALDPKGRMRIAAPDRTAAVINTDKVLTIRGIMGQEDYNVEELEGLIRGQTRQEDYLARNLSRICEQYLGSKIYCNIMMIGFAFQRGLIPVSMHSIAWAIKDTIRADGRKNLLAFNMGRKLVVQPELFQGVPPKLSWRETLEEKCKHLIRRHGNRAGAKRADELRHVAADAVTAVAELSEADKRDFVVRMYDCFRWGGPAYAARYAAAVRSVYEADSAGENRAAARAVLFNLAKAMLIKDGPFIAELATAPEKLARDRKKYNVNPANGDSITYRHLFNSTFMLGRREVNYSLPVRHWMMYVLRGLRGLRVLPGWHRREKLFLADYTARVEAFLAGKLGTYSQAVTQLGSPRCMDCLNPRCGEVGCPLENRVAEWIALAYDGRWREAAEKLHETNNFPEFTGAICPAPCQGECKQSHSDYPVQVRQIERRIVEAGFENGWIVPRPAAKKTGRKVAVVGSGPAGLAAAQQLARAGHDVTVLEQDAAPGGLLRTGIPAFRLDKAAIDRRVEQLKGEGVRFRCATAVGRDVSAAELREQFDAVLLATGAARPRDLAVPGREQAGVHFALDYLRQQNAAAAGVPAGGTGIDVKGKIVAVIGGGETGNDCVETALLQGAKAVHQLEILPPPSPDRKALAAPRHEPVGGNAAVKRRWAVATREFIANNGRLGGLRAVEVQWVQSDAGPRMKPQPQTEFSLRADVALLALGFDAALEPRLAEGFGLALDARGAVAASDHATSVPGVFVAGDLAKGASLVVTAIRSGRDAARKVDEYLAGLAR